MQGIYHATRVRDCSGYPHPPEAERSMSGKPDRIRQRRRRERPKKNSLHRLFFPEIDLNGNSCKVKMLPNLIFYKSFVRLFYILREVGKKGKLRMWCRQLGAEFYLYVFSFVRRWWRMFYEGQHNAVEFGGRDTPLSVIIYG